jgi:hypothetical protein
MGKNCGPNGPNPRSSPVWSGFDPGPGILVRFDPITEAEASWPECSGKLLICAYSNFPLKTHVQLGIIIDEIETSTNHDYEFAASNSGYL